MEGSQASHCPKQAGNEVQRGPLTNAEDQAASPLHLRTRGAVSGHTDIRNLPRPGTIWNLPGPPPRHVTALAFTASDVVGWTCQVGAWLQVLKELGVRGAEMGAFLGPGMRCPELPDRRSLDLPFFPLSLLPSTLGK